MCTAEVSSRRCRAVDLSRWLGGVYRIPAEEEDDAEAAAEEAEDGPASPPKS